MIKIRVPATSANLGPGFDCLGLSLDIWNEVTFDSAEKLSFQASGEGAEKLNKGSRNLLTRAFFGVYDVCGRPRPGICIRSSNDIPMSSGLGSSAAAIVSGLFGANEMLGRPLDDSILLKMASDMEGHPDNVAAALNGGLVVSIMLGNEIITRKYEIPDFTVVIVKPDLDWPTRLARSVLPKSVSRTDAIFNLGRTVLVVDALRNGGLELLQKVMEDRIHQSYRLKHISGGMAAYKTARQFGAAALSGAGPALITFVKPDLAEQARNEIGGIFEERGIKTHKIITSPTGLGVHRVQPSN